MRALAMIALVMSIGGCRETRGVRWEVATSDPALRARTAIVVAEVSRGSCLDEGEPIYREEVAIGSMSPAVPTLGGGAHAFRAIARDAACIEIARGCQEIVLPGEPDQLGSLKGQDVGKLIVAAGILLGVLGATAASITGSATIESFLAFFTQKMLT